MYLSLNSLANSLPNGRVTGNKVVCSGPEAASQKLKWKRRRHTLTVYINGDDIGVNCHHPDQDPIDSKDWVELQCGLPAWKPRTPKGPKRDPIPRKVRNCFFAETLNVLRYWKHLRKQITAEQLNLLINDLRPKDETTLMWARWYASEFGFEGFTYTKHHTYTADQRAKILGVTYADRQWLGLRRTGAIDLDKAGRERARRDRYNAKRRAKRAIETNQRSRRVLDVCKRGVNRQVPSLEAVIVTKVVTESEDKAICIRPRIMESYKSCPKIVRIDLKKRRPPPVTIPKDRLDSAQIPFLERVELMQCHCGLSRVDAEAEARKWLLN